ncbi:MAG: RagB/SusD family nutrient uptake outer membrane protein [Bacteroidales bacterium]
MKNKLINIAFCATLALTGCNDSFLEKYPVTDLTEQNAFKSYDNFKAFMWPCYNMFSNNTIATSVNNVGQDSHYQGDRWAGYLGHKSPSGFNKYAFQTVNSVASGNGWDFSSFIRRINIMLSHVDKAEMTQEEKNHWRAVGYFFHSFWYMELIDRFGDVPWIDKVLTENSPEAYGPRTPRLEVATNILNNLKWAEENIGNFESRDGKNTINKECIQVAISRFTLREATWRKYHEIGNYDNLLQECIRVSKLLIDKYPTLYTGTDGQPAAGYGELWTTESLENIPGIILYKEYVTDIAPANFSYMEHTSSHNMEMGQEIVDLYLMKNGKPIQNEESGYHGDKTMYETFRDRDPRMYHVIMPPYKVKQGGGEFKTWSYTDNPADREYIDIMGANTSCSNPGIGMKRLPGQNWSASLVPEIPRLGTGAFVTCRSGYYVWKNWSNWEKSFNNGALNTADKPIFKIEEIMLNYAEAMYEAGNFNQAIADITINKLRNRAGVTPMNVASIDANFDPNRAKYYPKGNTDGIALDPLLWEIRRERIIELMGEGFGFYDVRRWRMAPWFLNKTHKGIWSKKKDLPSGMTLLNESNGTSDGVNGVMTEGYVFLYNNPLTEAKGWLEKYYLFQVPTTELVLNPNLAPNNPGWE